MEKLLILDCRNFGDSVVGLGLVEALSQSFPGIQIDALTRPQFASMRLNHPAILNVECAAFPMGTMKNFDAPAALGLLSTSAKLRARKYDAVVNIVGDFRENTLGYLINRKANWGPVWSDGHPILNGIKCLGKGLPVHPVLIEKEAVSVYGAVDKVARALGATVAARPRLYNSSKQPIRKQRVSGLVGMHMSASQQCRKWPAANWVELGMRLIRAGKHLRMYCSPAEHSTFAGEYSALLMTGQAELISGTLDQFFESLAECALVVAHDSFALHVAYALDVPRIVINGPNLMPVWAPPGTVMLQENHGLSCYPCFNRPQCESGPEPYACIRKVQVGMVYDAVAALDSRL